MLGGFEKVWGIKGISDTIHTRLVHFEYAQTDETAAFAVENWNLSRRSQKKEKKGKMLSGRVPFALRCGQERGTC